MAREAKADVQSFQAEKQGLQKRLDTAEEQMLVYRDQIKDLQEQLGLQDEKEVESLLKKCGHPMLVLTCLC